MRTPHLTLALLSVGCALAGCNRQSAVIAPVSAPAAPQEARADKDEKQPAPVEQAKEPSAHPAPFAGDKGGKLVGQLLKPSDEPLEAEARKEREQRPLPAAAFLERPSLPLPRFSGPLPRLAPQLAAPSVQPRALTEGPPLDRYRADPAPPRRQEFPGVGLIAVPSPDLNQPVPLPILAKPQQDRAPLTDPTADVSLAAALAAPVPMRTAPAPFVRFNLPEPFEHVQTARLQTTVEEDPVPPVAIPRTPAK